MFWLTIFGLSFLVAVCVFFAMSVLCSLILSAELSRKEEEIATQSEQSFPRVFNRFAR